MDLVVVVVDFIIVVVVVDLLIGFKLMDNVSKKTLRNIQFQCTSHFEMYYTAQG